MSPVAPPRNSLPPLCGVHGSEERLTCIHGRIHCVAAEQPSEDECELQELEIGHFINALAEVALAVARRREETES